MTVNVIRKAVKSLGKPSAVTIMMNPAKYGYEECTHCSGYGSSLKEDAARCTVCASSDIPGLVKEVNE